MVSVWSVVGNHWTDISMCVCVCVLQTEIKNILEGIYGIEVESVKTINYLGKKKRSKDAIYRRADFKKAYVVLKDPQ